MSVIDYRHKLVEVADRVDMIEAAYEAAVTKAGDPDEDLLDALVDTFFDVKYQKLQRQKQKLLSWIRVGTLLSLKGGNRK